MIVRTSAGSKSVGGRVRLNVSAGTQRALPRALVLALLLGGTSAFVTQEQQVGSGPQDHPGGGGRPGHERPDHAADPDWGPRQSTTTGTWGTSGSGARRSTPVGTVTALRPVAMTRALPPLPTPPELVAQAGNDARTAVTDTVGSSAGGEVTAVAGAARVLIPFPVLVPAPAAAPAPAQTGPGAATGRGTGAGSAAGQAAGRHASHVRPADSGRSAHRRPGESRSHSHRRSASVTLHTTGGMNWSVLARCEAGGNPHAVDPSGRYGGLYQFDSGTWHSLGGRGRPQDASSGEQTTRARELYQRRGAAPWPSCGPRAGG